MCPISAQMKRNITDVQGNNFLSSLNIVPVAIYNIEKATAPTRTRPVIALALMSVFPLGEEVSFCHFGSRPDSDMAGSG